MPKVSILMPCYNVAATVEETMQSISAQTYDDFEVVVVDDGSTDTTSEILTRWAGADAKFRVLPPGTRQIGKDQFKAKEARLFGRVLGHQTCD